MRTVNFRDDVVYAIAYKMGMEPRKDLLVDQATAYVSFVNHHVRQTYEKLDWPEWTLIEPRTPSGTHYIDPDDPTPIGKVLKVYVRDPDVFSHMGTPVDAPFRLNEEGIYIFPHGTNVWVKFVKRAPQYTFDAWNSVATYPVGSLVYRPAPGSCFKALLVSDPAHPPPNGDFDNANWEYIPFPLAICGEVVRGAYADALRDDGQHDKAAAEEKAAGAETRAGNFLAEPFDPLTDQHVNQARYEVGK